MLVCAFLIRMDQKTANVGKFFGRPLAPNKEALLAVSVIFNCDTPTN
jgi:hypothetical protein